MVQTPPHMIPPKKGSLSDALRQRVVDLEAFAGRTASYMLWLRDCSDREMMDGDLARAVARRLLGRFDLLGIAEKSQDCGNGTNPETP